MFQDLQQADVGFYIGLLPGGELDMRVAANAALSFDLFMRKLTAAIEPGAVIELNLIQGEIGSLNLISSFKARLSKQTLNAIAFIAAGWLGGELLSFTAQEFFAYLSGKLTEEQVQEIGEVDLKRIAEACFRATQDPEIAESHTEITTTLAADSDVTAVGVTLSGEKKPRIMMPRSEFPIIAARAQLLQRNEMNGGVRLMESRRELILTEPVLIDKPRKWRFLMGKQEVSATISDEAFRQKVLQGKLDIVLSQGITITAIVVITEERLEADLWKPIKYDVKKVLDWRANPSQPSLFSDGNQDED